MDSFLDDNLNISEIALAVFVAAGNADRLHKNRPNHGLALLCGGEYEYDFSNGKKIIVRKNDIIYLPKFSNYNVTFSEPGDCWAINFDIDLPNNFDSFSIHTKNSGFFSRCFRHAEQSWRKRELGFQMKCKSELYNILYQLRREMCLGYAASGKQKKLSPAISYIHENYTTELLSVEKLAGMCKITPEYFRQLFHQLYGVSPVKYINQLKISRAGELLSSGMYSVFEAAEMSGFSDASHFSREFKKSTSMTPSEFRTRHITP